MATELRSFPHFAPRPAEIPPGGPPDGTGGRVFGMSVRISMTIAAALLGVALGGFACDDNRAPPPVLGTLPAFELTDHRDQPFGSEQLRGHAWVANFVFTRCPTVCPVFTQRMAQLRDSFAEHDASVQLVSFSVDPDYDTPQVLAAYAKAQDAEAPNWTFSPAHGNRSGRLCTTG